MTFERMPGPMGGEPARRPSATRSGRLAGRVAAPGAGHGALGTPRDPFAGLDELFTRAGMFLSTLSGAIVALALVAQATSFGDEFATFAP